MQVVTRESMKDIADSVAAAGKFSTLIHAAKEAGLIEVLKGEGPFTLFAPTDEAFAKLPEGTMDALRRDPRRLQSVLTCHLVRGELKAADLANFKELRAIQHQKLSIATDEGLAVNNAKVLMSDILAANGIMHIVDSVILS